MLPSPGQTGPALSDRTGPSCSRCGAKPGRGSSRGVDGQLAGLDRVLQRARQDHGHIADCPGWQALARAVVGPAGCLKLAVERSNPGAGQAGQRDAADVRRNMQPDVLLVRRQGARPQLTLVGQPLCQVLAQRLPDRPREPGLAGRAARASRMASWAAFLAAAAVDPRTSALSRPGSGCKGRRPAPAPTSEIR